MEASLSDSHFFSIAQGSILSTPVATTLATGQKPSRLPEPITASTTSSPISAWGDDNLYPNYILSEIEKVTLVHPILDWKARALYGGGIAYGLLDVQNGTETFTQLVDPEIDDWLENSEIQEYIMKSALGLVTFYNIMPELIFSIDRSKITRLSALDPHDVRWEKRARNGKYRGYSEHAYLSPDWETIDDKSSETLKIRVLQTAINAIEFARTVSDDKLIFPTQLPSSGKKYYARAPWHVLLDTWLPIAKEIPAFKKALLKNQLTVKYIIRVPEWWWTWKYKDWEKKSEQERINIIQAEHKSFNDFTTGDKQGNSIMYTQRDSTPAKEYGAWEIDVIDDKIGNGKYIEDSQEADAHIFKNLAVDPTLFGTGPGKNNQSSGSGSDKRVAFNTYILQQSGMQHVMLKPLHFIAKYNGWSQRLTQPGQRLVFWLQNFKVAKLDSGAETQATSPNNES